MEFLIEQRLRKLVQQLIQLAIIFIVDHPVEQRIGAIYEIVECRDRLILPLSALQT